MALNKDQSCLGNSKDIAIRRLNSLWKRLSRDSSYLSLYAEFLKEYEELGHLERVVESSEPPTHYYIPHHGVLRPEKLTTKLRIVFNGSSPTTTGISLNDILLKGEVKEDVFETISRFRRHKFAFTTDIQKIYRQILINPDQQDLQRIIWKHGLDAEILTYRLKTVTYWLSNAPFLAIRTLQQLAKDEKSRFPLASETLLYDTCMDDIVSGAPDLETAQQLQSQLKDSLQSCGMNLHKWSSNSPELLNSSLSSDIEHSFSTDIDLSVKTLGISWKPFEDCFAFKVSVSAKHIYTKREVLSVIAKLYDPLGFLGPVIAKAKVFLQQLWQCKLDWDDVLPNSIANEWREFVTTLKCIEEVKINRFIMADNNVRIVLQGFADASEAAYGAVVYLQCFLHNGAAKVSILASKSRVAPIRVISIPRLELCACVLLAQLVKKIHSTLRLNISDIVLHTDSTIALACDGLLRVGGRLSNSDLPYVNKHPAILPGNHNLTVQIIVHFHRKNLHTGASSLLHYVREKFWPLNGRSLCRKVVHECLVCFKSRPLVTSQLMGILPHDRVVPDYLFNCSAIHIEIVSDLTSDALIATLKRFFSRRGKCAKFYSDNGKTFVGVNKELKRFLKLIEDSDDNLAGFLSAEDLQLTRTDEKLLRILAYQRLQQLLPVKKSKTSVEKINGNSSDVPIEVRGRAIICPVDKRGLPVPMCYRSLHLGMGADMDVCFSNYGHCNFLSAKHASIFYDEITKRYELLNYSYFGTTVDNVLYSSDVSEKHRLPPPPNSFSAAVRKLARSTPRMANLPSPTPPVERSVVSARGKQVSWKKLDEEFIRLKL
ncbi:PHD finger protein 12 [Trichonephila clavipes]|uniref:PHD finger protein 12 n=1 Tax=Trichonephila clavipes TaxID=2585209 RepID=A0A8X6VGS4_TRICX|nr:PHD finger protein 12 [Trichonephila clavipes]